MKWNITGAFKDTGEDTAITIEADNRESATRRANRRGIVVSTVTPEPGLSEDDSGAAISQNLSHPDSSSATEHETKASLVAKADANTLRRPNSIFVIGLSLFFAIVLLLGAAFLYGFFFRPVTKNTPTLTTSGLHYAKNEKCGVVEKEAISALKASDLDSFKRAMAQEPNVNAGDPETGQSILALACDTGSDEVVKMVLSRHPDVNIRDDDDSTPLFTAVGKGAKLTKLLLDAGADPHALNNLKQTPLFRYCTGDSIKLLVRAGTGIDQVDVEGDTALHGDAAGGWLDLVQALLANGASVNIRDNKGHTALKSAELGFQNEVAAALKLRGATE